MITVVIRKRLPGLMKLKQSNPKAPFITTVGFLAIIPVIWLYLLPVQFGGRAVYLIISGRSMEPTFYEGALVFLHQTDNYKIGDIAAYYEPFTGGIIIHRIIAKRGERFILLGDNKPRIDPLQPTLSEMVGKYWFHLPALGKIARSFRVNHGDWPTQTLVTVAGFILMIPKVMRKSQPQKRSHSRKEQPVSQSNQHKISITDLVLFLVALAFASSLLAFLAFSTPSSHLVNDNQAYEQWGTFSYAAKAPPGIYSADEVQTGQPVFRRLINKVAVIFDYEFTSELPANVHGTYRVIAELSHDNGWNSTFELLPQTPFDTHTFSTRAILDLAQIQTLIDNLEQQTGLHGQRYTLAIIPEVAVSGSLNSQPLQDEFSPRLDFELDAVQLRLESSPASANQPPPDPLKPSQVGQVKGKRLAPNTLSIFNFMLDVSTARQIAIVGLAISLGSLPFLGVLLFRAHRADEAARIQFKHGKLLIPIQASSVAKAEEVVEMAAIDDLVRLAEREGRMILYHANGTGHHYLLKDGPITYHYHLKPTNDDHSNAENHLSKRISN